MQQPQQRQQPCRVAAAQQLRKSNCSGASSGAVQQCVGVMGKNATLQQRKAAPSARPRIATEPPIRPDDESLLCRQPAVSIKCVAQVCTVHSLVVSEHLAMPLPSSKSAKSAADSGRGLCSGLGSRRRQCQRIQGGTRRPQTGPGPPRPPSCPHAAGSVSESMGHQACEKVKPGRLVGLGVMNA